MERRGDSVAEPLAGDGAHVTLVLGAGGVAAHAFHAAVLRALHDGRGWDARSADLVIGTSAGAQAGALLRAGWTARDLFARVSGGPACDDTEAPPLLVMPAGPPCGPRHWPASRAYLRRALARPWRAHPGVVAAALLPEGRHETLRLGRAIERVWAHGAWPTRPLWIPAVELDTGGCVVFGRDGAPTVDVSTAVRCSSAVPGYRCPVRLGSARYVDGGIVSPTYATLAVHAPATRPRRAIVLSPLSAYAPLRLLLRRELRRLKRAGIAVTLFEPDAATARAIGLRPLRGHIGPAVCAAAYRMAMERLRDGG